MAAVAPCRACLRTSTRQVIKSAIPESRSIHRLAYTHTLRTKRVSAVVFPRTQYRNLSSTLSLCASEQPSTPSSLTSPNLIREATQSLFKECARQADYIIPQAFTSSTEIPTTASGEHIGEGTGFWYEQLHLTPTFNTWAQVTFLHMYLLTARLRMLPPDVCGLWLQQLHDAFFYEAEHRMTIFHQLSSRGVRNKYLKDLYNQWRGVQGAYDEGLIKGDAVLAAAVWRNVWGASDDVDWRDVAQVVSFMRRGLKGLERAGDAQIAGAMVRFGSPASEKAIVESPSRGLATGFGEQESKEAEKLVEEIKKLGSR